MSVTESRESRAMFHGSGFWSKRTRSQKYAIVVMLLLVIAAIVAVCCVFLVKKRTPAICDSAVCHSEAGNLLANLKPERDPCHDFYDFACGLYEETHEIPLDKGRLATFDSVADNVLDRLKLMYAKPADEQRVKPLKFISLFYQACNSSVNNEQPLRDMLSQMGGWPAARIPSSRPTLDNSWQSTLLVVITEFGEEILASISVSPNPYNTTTYAISV